MRISGIIKESITDGPGMRYTIFTQGCYHKCEGCHNPQTHDPNLGYDKPIKEIYDEIIANPLLDGVTYSGGEPFLHADELSDLSIMINNNENINLDIICYTGYTWEELIELCNHSMSYRRLLSHIDYLVDGKYEKDKSSLDCLFRGSTNQRFIDVKKSISRNEIVTLKDEDLK